MIFYGIQRKCNDTDAALKQSEVEEGHIFQVQICRKFQLNLHVYHEQQQQIASRFSLISVHVSFSLFD